ncbi:endonuclease-reverse transcriptase [Lasius niger]|uniref:Endonuclease-reverse transcriptase n=1 Tax=Lasius niger TaxID=67767 RepID=A0A0J7KGF7_LASNI|nr:endonuclease-reverse transcriptase [Lasius niger]
MAYGNVSYHDALRIVTGQEEGPEVGYDRYEAPMRWPRLPVSYADISINHPRQEEIPKARRGLALHRYDSEMEEERRLSPRQRKRDTAEWQEVAYERPVTREFQENMSGTEYEDIGQDRWDQRSTKVASNIDLIFAEVNIVDSITYNQIKDTWGSDHFPLDISIDVTIIQYEKITNRISKKKTNWTAYTEYVEKEVETLGLKVKQGSLQERYFRLTELMKVAVNIASGRISKRKGKDTAGSQRKQNRGPINRSNGGTLSARRLLRKEKLRIYKRTQDLHSTTSLKYIWNVITFKKAWNKVRWNKWQEVDREQVIREEIDKLSPPGVSEADEQERDDEIVNESHPLVDLDIVGEISGDKKHQERRTLEQLRYTNKDIHIIDKISQKHWLCKNVIVINTARDQRVLVLQELELYLTRVKRCLCNSHAVYFSGSDDTSRNSVAFVIPSELAGSVLGYNTVSDRIISVRIKAAPCVLNFIQVYAPTADADAEDIDNFYSSLQTTIEKTSNREITVIMGDWNAKVGRTDNDNHIRNAVGRYGIGTRNERENNTPGRHQITVPKIDYILINNRWRSAILSAKTLPGADCGSDHKLLAFKLRVRMKRCKGAAVKAKLPPITDQSAFLSRLNHEIASTDMEELTDPDDLWNRLKDVIETSLIEQQSKERAKNRDWISANTFKIIEERRKLLATGLNNTKAIDEYRRLSSSIQTNCRRDKNNFLNDICADIQLHANRFQSKDVFHKIKQITRKFKPRTWTISDENGVPVTEIDSIIETWRRYCERLYAKDELVVASRREEYEREPHILIEEVERAVGRLANNKVWTTTVWPKEWITSVIVPLHKKGPTCKCENYRLIALITHASKILLHIIHSRLQPFADRQIAPEQAGFVSGRGTREQILNLRQLIEKAREYYMPMFLCFVDYEKAFDNVKWHLLWPILGEMGFPLHLIYFIKNLYENSTAVVRLESTTSQGSRVPPLKTRKSVIRKGVRQGCILSPLLYNIYSEYIMRQVLEDWNGGVTIGGEKISNLRYADDTLLVARSKEELLALLDRLNNTSLDYGLHINNTKTRIMIVDREHNFPGTSRIDRFEVVDKFVYMGALINNRGDCGEEIRRRIQLGRVAMSLSKESRKGSDDEVAHQPDGPMQLKQLLNTNMEEAVRATINRDGWRTTIRDAIRDMEGQA